MALFSALCILPVSAAGEDWPLRVARERREEIHRPASSENEGESAGEADLKRRMDDVLPLLEELSRERAGYGGERTENDSARREALRERLKAALERYSEGLASFHAEARGEQTRRLGGILSAEAPMDEESIRRTVRLNDFDKRAASFQSAAMQLLREDESAFAAARDARRRAAKRRRLAGAALLTALAGGWSFWKLRRRASPGESSGSAGESGARAMEASPVLDGNYRIERELGRGGMGVVLEALDLNLRRKVALKRMREEISRNADERERFLAEARLVAGLKHPNIVEIHTFFSAGAELYLVFEFVPGEPLSRLLAGGARLPLARVRGLLRQIASALDYAHSRRIIHRDLKPANVMVAPGDGVKVMDFGLAHRARMTAAHATRAAAAGTLDYMAPEQEVGEVSRESDIFSLGVCLYEMLTGTLPFGDLEQKRRALYRPASDVVAGLPPFLDAVLARAFAPDPRRRFRSGAELADAAEAR